MMVSTSISLSLTVMEDILSYSKEKIKNVYARVYRTFSSI
jgi:hypothetical protein